MTIGLAVTIRNNRANQIRNAIDAGGAAGTLIIYSGSKPTPTGAAINPAVNFIMGELTFAYPCASDASNGVLSFNPIVQEDAAPNAGTAVWARIKDSNATFVMDLDVTNNSGSGDIKLNSTTIIAGGPISIISASITEGNG